MTPARWDALDALFADVADLPPAARAAALAACPDPALRAEAEALLAADTAAEAAHYAEHPAGLYSLLEELWPPPAGFADDLGVGARVGPWRVAGELGRGGMGVVYRAERADGAYRQAVAVKVVKRGMDTDAVVRRFARERAVLAGLDHPAIARVLDGGAASDGRPYFAMELVDGEPLTAYADRQALSVEARLGLFLDVCAAVAYAHRRLVVHRDLKPSNVLVAEDDPPASGGRGAPRVKLLDFGLAKVLGDEDGADRTQLTGEGPRLLTPEYAAPEQFGGEVTTATDVYALGVLLYELLTGGRPYSLAGGGLVEVERTVRDATPSRPSVAVASLPARRAGPPGTVAPVPEGAARARSTTPERLARRLRGDLDTVVLKALRKEPERRYASVDALADDVRRHLAGQPVLARPDTSAYRAGKFVGRHRWTVAAAALALGAVVVGAGVAVGQAREAAAARVRAEEEVIKASTMISFLESLFAQGEGRLEDRTAREVLADGERRVDELRADPAVYARVLGLLGGIYRTTGDYGAAERPLRRALAVQERLRPPDDLLLADARFDLGYLLTWSGQTAEADSLVRLALAARRARLAPSDGPVVFAEATLAAVLTGQRLYAEAEGHYRAALAGAEAMATVDERESHVSGALSGLADVLVHQGRGAEADSLARRALALALRRSGSGGADVGHAWMAYGRFVQRRGDPGRALAPLRRGHGLLTRRFPPGHPWRASADAALGEALAAAGRPAEAEPLLARALTVARARDEPGSVAHRLVALGTVLDDLGRSGAAERLLREALRIHRNLPEPNPVLVAEVEDALAALAR